MYELKIFVSKKEVNSHDSQFYVPNISVIASLQAINYILKLSGVNSYFYTNLVRM